MAKHNGSKRITNKTVNSRFLLGYSCFKSI